MHDNGLLKYYRDYADRQGQLKAYELFSDCNTRNINSAIKVYYTRNGELSKKYFEKFCGFARKNVLNAELIQSQVFKDNGLTTAIYTPSVTEYGQPCVISDGITTGTSNQMGNFLVKCLEDFVISYSPYSKQYNITPNDIEFDKLFKPNAMKKFILGHALDVAGGNVDRHTGNFEVELSKTESGLDIIEDIIYYDYGNTIFEFPEEQENIYYFTNGLGFGVDQNRGSMIAILRNSPHVLEYYSPDELAGIIGSTDFTKIAREYKEQTNFEIDKQFLYRIEKSYYNMAQGLVNGVPEDSLIQDLVNGMQ